MENRNENEEPQSVGVPTPKQIYNYLDEYVIGQSEAKKVLSVAIYNHYKRFLLNVYGAGANAEGADEGYVQRLKDVVIDKSNVLMLGNTGTGKTYMVKMITKMLGIPCYIADATKLTESGFVGQDVETILTGLLQDADGNVERAECGVVILDEIDKLGRRGENASLTRDVGGEGVQQGLLKIVEGCKVQVPPQGGRIHPEAKLIEMDTTNILFIGMGAFDGMEKIVERRMNTTAIGFGNILTREKKTDDEKTKALLSKVRQEDLKKFGIIPELIGRFPIIAHTNPLSEEDLVRILTEPKNSILKQYEKLLYFDGVNLAFEDEALKLVARIANKTKTGARGLRSILENVLTEIMFDYGDTVREKREDVLITKDYVVEALKEKYDIDDTVVNAA